MDYVYLELPTVVSMKPWSSLIESIPRNDENKLSSCYTELQFPTD